MDGVIVKRWKGSTGTVVLTVQVEPGLLATTPSCQYVALIQRIAFEMSGRLYPEWKRLTERGVPSAQAPSIVW